MPNEQQGSTTDDQQAQGANGAGDGQAQGANQQNADGSAGGDATGAQGADGGSDETPEQLRARIKQLSDESAKYRTRARDAEGKLTAAERAAMDEAGRTAAERDDAVKERDALREQLADLTIGAAVTAAAGALKFHDPADAMAHLKRDAITDDDGKVDPEKVRAQLTQLVKDKPYLAVAAPPGDGAGGRNGSSAASGSMNDLIRGKARG